MIQVCSGYAGGMSQPVFNVVRCLKEAEARSVWLVEDGEGRRLTVKTWPLSGGVVLKTILGISQLQRQIRGTRRLMGLGIRTPEVVGKRWAKPTLQIGGYRFARPTLRLAYVEGENGFDLWHVEEPDRDRLIPAVRQIGEMVRIMVAGRTLNRDFKLNNLILAEREDGPEVWVIDTVGVRRCRNRVRATFRMLERLIIQATPELLAEREWAWRPVVRAAMRGMTGLERGEVFRRLREHLRS